jgi:hypothetical protein
MGLIALGEPVLAQEPAKGPVIPYDGVEVFTYLLKQQRFTPVKAVSDLAALPANQTLVIIFGAAGVVERLPLATFLNKGGAVLVASDHAGTLQPWGVMIGNEKVAQIAELAYRNVPDCPLVTSLSAHRPAEFHAPVRGLATNRPTFFFQPIGRPGNRRLQPLADFPRKCHLARVPNLRVPQDLRLPELRFMLYDEGTPNSPAPSVLLPGHGLFTNGMMLQSDNDNFDFAVDCLRWLGTAPDGKPRAHALFIVDGDVVRSFDVSLKARVPPIPVPTIQLVNRLLHGAEQEGLVIRILNDSVNVQSVAAWALRILTILLMLYGIKKLGEVRYHPESRSTLLFGPFARPPDVSSLLLQRHQSQIDQGALGEEARALVRQWYVEVCGIPATDWTSQPDIAAPEFDVAGSWWERFRMRRRTDRLWELATQRAAGVHSWRDLVRLTRWLKELSDAVHEGRLCFVGCSAVENS